MMSSTHLHKNEATAKFIFSFFINKTILNDFIAKVDNAFQHNPTSADIKFRFWIKLNIPF